MLDKSPMRVVVCSHFDRELRRAALWRRGQRGRAPHAAWSPVSERRRRASPAPPSAAVSPSAVLDRGSGPARLEVLTSHSPHPPEVPGWRVLLTSHSRRPKVEPPRRDAWSIQPWGPWEGDRETQKRQPHFLVLVRIFKSDR